MKTFFICLLVGIAAQLIDGTLGMAYGVSCSTFLRTAGISSALSSACVHVAEIFTTLASGISHFSMKNVDKTLLWRLAIPGVLGGCLGAYVLTSVDDRILSPLISAYLVVMGCVIVSKIFKKDTEEGAKPLGFWVCPLAMLGGFSDSLGGGGWGPVVTSTLVAANHDVRKTIGSVNTAEFFVTLGESLVFIATLPDLSSLLSSMAGLIVGGILAAPVGAILCRKLPVKPLLGIVGGVIILINGWRLVSTWIG